MNTPHKYDITHQHRAVTAGKRQLQISNDDYFEGNVISVGIIMETLKGAIQPKMGDTGLKQMQTASANSLHTWDATVI